MFSLAFYLANLAYSTSVQFLKPHFFGTIVFLLNENENKLSKKEKKNCVSTCYWPVLLSVIIGNLSNNPQGTTVLNLMKVAEAGNAKLWFCSTT